MNNAQFHVISPAEVYVYFLIMQKGKLEYLSTIYAFISKGKKKSDQIQQ